MGAGIGGLCLAQALQKNKISFTIYEKNDKAEDWLDGYRIHIRSVGSKALHQCLPFKQWNDFLNHTGLDADGIGFLTEDFEELVHVPEKLMIGQNPEPYLKQYAINRTDLRKILLSDLDESINYGKKLDRFEQLENGSVKIFFADGTNEEADILIGADGANSKVRQQYLPNARRVETGAIAIGGRTMLTVESRKWIPITISGRMNVVMPKDKFFFFNAFFDKGKDVDSDKCNYILWSLVGDKKYFQDVSVESDLKQKALSLIPHWNPIYKKIISEGDGDTLLLLNIKTMLPIKSWAASSVTLMGDAIHNMTPMQGMGANMALYDAFILSKQLIEVVLQRKDKLEAIKAYETDMRNKGFAAVAKSMKYTHKAISENRLIRLMSRNWFRLCNKVFFLKKISFGNNWKD
nr:NAD(P)/FAD-dependent oxidoreductase [Pedobacter borealis]